MYNVYLGRKVNYYRNELNSKRAILNDLKTLSERREIAARIAREESKLRETLSLFDSTIPGAVTLTKLSYDNAARKMNISGITNNISLVGRFLTNIENSPSFSRAVLIETKKGLGDNTGAMGFDMTFHVD
jgi:Tfp pilus assembly protein PilN